MNISFFSQASTRTTELRTIRGASSKTQLIGHHAALFVALLGCSLAIFLLGANYYGLFPTNGNTLYAASTTAVFLSAAIIFKRSKSSSRYWGITYAFFVASAVNLISDLFGKFNSKFVDFFGLATDQNMVLGLGKLYDAMLVVITILVLTVISGENLGTLFLKIGNQYRKWGYGIGALILVNFFTSVLIFFGSGYALPKLGSAIAWGLVFSFSNSILEELWIRGLFLKKLVPLIGVGGTVLLTSMTFAALHFLGLAYLPASVVPIFVANTFTMGLACGILMLKTDSIWGAFLIHAAADLFLWIATLASH